MTVLRCGLTGQVMEVSGVACRERDCGSEMKFGDGFVASRGDCASCLVVAAEMDELFDDLVGAEAS